MRTAVVIFPAAIHGISSFQSVSKNEQKKTRHRSYECDYRALEKLSMCCATHSSSRACCSGNISGRLPTRRKRQLRKLIHVKRWANTNWNAFHAPLAPCILQSVWICDITLDSSWSPQPTIQALRSICTVNFGETED